MSAPPGVVRREQWWLRPAVALPVLAGLIALATIFTPQPQDGRSGDSRLSTYSSGAQGARLLYELAGRLGWETRRVEASGLPSDSAAILAILDPVVPPRAAEAHAVLEHVRRGGGLLYVMGGAGALNDSLGVRRGPGLRAAVLPEITGPIDDRCAKATNGALPMWAGSDMHLWSVRTPRVHPDRVIFVDTDPAAFPAVPAGGPAAAGDDRRVPAAIGFPLGSGRVVVIADPDLLRNDVLRVCRWGADVAAVRMLEYLSRGARRPLVFDEFRQGHGARPGTMAAIARFFARTPPGHLLAQLVVAGLVLLAACAPRLVPPRDAARVERRSPAEHVQALARAYEKVGATRTAVLRLVHGLRRRTARLGAPPLGADGDPRALLDWIARRAPDAAADVALVRQALAAPVPTRELVRIGEAVRRIELALTSSPTPHLAARPAASPIDPTP